MDEKKTIHSRTIFLLQRDFPGSQTKGFRKAIQKLQWDWEGWGDGCQVEPGENKPTWADFMDWGEAWKDGIIPDLWFIDEECMSVVCIEVEDTNRINTSKLDRYIGLWWHLDEMYWETHLICSDRWGNLTPVPLTDFTSMGMVDINNHRNAQIIQLERDVKKVVFDLTKIYSLRDVGERNLARQKWLEENPECGLRTNPEFNKESFLRRRSLSAAGS
jgi:hypothetical protein